MRWALLLLAGCEWVARSPGAPGAPGAFDCVCRDADGVDVWAGVVTALADPEPVAEGVCEFDIGVDCSDCFCEAL